MNILKLFMKPQEPKTIFDYSQSIRKDYVIKAFRGIALKNNVSPTQNISDKEIIDIYQKTGIAFIEASNKRNRFLPGRQLNKIILDFYHFYENDKNTFEEKLQTEINYYIKNGLKNEYLKELDLSEFYK